MGNTYSPSSTQNHRFVLPKWLSPKPPELRMLITGLDAAGKTSILYWWKLGEVITVLPTIGFNVETISSAGSDSNAATIVSWDVGGRDRTRPLLRHYYANTSCLVFVIDSSDRDRLVQAKDELHRLLAEEELQGLPLLVLCNKQDLPNVMSASQILDHLFDGVVCDGDDDGNTTSVRKINRPVNVEECSVVDGTGLREGLSWLARAATTTKKIGVVATTTTKNGATINVEQRNELSDIAVGTSSKAKPTSLSSVLLGRGPTDIDTNAAVLQNFRPIQRGSSCPFAKAAKLWGATVAVEDNDTADTTADAIRNAAFALAEFVRQSNNGESLDGFCIELGKQAAAAVHPSDFGTHVYAILRALSDLDPSGERIMQVSYIGARGWRYRFARADFFVTTFAPCYPTTSSRYAFGTGRAFVLLQPELSFLRHRLPADTPITHDPPETIRDKTRQAFRDAGRSYYIPSTTRYPPADHIVKPLYDDGVTIIRWWENKKDDSGKMDESKEVDY